MKAFVSIAAALLVGVVMWIYATRAPETKVVERSVVVPIVETKTAQPGGRRAAAAARAEASGDDDIAALRARYAELRVRQAELEKQLAALQEKAADLDAMDPLAFVMGAKKPISWKAKRVAAIEPEKDRNMAAWKLGQSFADKDDAAKGVLEALRTETDPKVLAVLAEMLRAGGASKATPEDRRGFAEVLKTGATPEARRAAVRGVWMSDGGRDEKSRAVAKEMNAALVDAVKTDASPEVVGAIASAFADWQPPPEAMDALKDAGTRLPPSPDRRKVWEAIARGSFMGDAGAALVQQFEAATAQDVRDDIAAGIARAGNSMGGGGAGGAPAEIKKRLDDARARFRSVFSKTGDVAVRRSLARASLYGLGCVAMGMQTDEQKADVGRFFRDVAGLEPDAVQRERFERIAAAFESKGAMAYQDFDKINNGRE